MSELVDKLEESNRAKYGEKEFDQIAENYRISKESGDTWCAENVKRYLNRFKRPGSTKSNNLTDLYKAKDYLNRMIEANEKLSNISTKEVEENFTK
jgi:hypothetical protein